MAKNTGKVREFCQSGKVGTLYNYCRVIRWESFYALKDLKNFFLYPKSQLVYYYVKPRVILVTQPLMPKSNYIILD